MIKMVVAATAIASICLSAAQAADQKARTATAAPAAVVAVQDCSAFYDDYARRGFGWGSGPGTSVGFGTFEGALPRYPENSFPNWYGICREWGRYSATGAAARW